MRTGIRTTYINVPSVSCQRITALVAVLPRINIDLLILTLNHGYNCCPEVNNINKPNFIER